MKRKSFIIKEQIEELKKKGFQRLKVDGNIYEIDEVPNLKKNFKHFLIEKLPVMCV